MADPVGSIRAFSYLDNGNLTDLKTDLVVANNNNIRGVDHQKRLVCIKVQEEKEAWPHPCRATLRNVKKVIPGISIFYTNANEFINNMVDLKMLNLADQRIPSSDI